MYVKFAILLIHFFLLFCRLHTGKILFKSIDAKRTKFARIYCWSKNIFFLCVSQTKKLLKTIPNLYVFFHSILFYSLTSIIYVPLIDFLFVFFSSLLHSQSDLFALVNGMRRQGTIGHSVFNLFMFLALFLYLLVR